MPIFGLKGKYVLFIHIPKCGGTSVENAIKEVSDGFFLFCPHRADLPTAAQHFHRPLLEAIIPNIERYVNFTVVRHPVARALSEYFHDTRRQRRENNIHLPDFSAWVAGRLSAAERNAYISDNHLRRQAEFILPNTTIFHFERGLEAPIRFALAALGAPDTFDLPHEKNWNKDISLHIELDTIAMIEHFYLSDMEYFGYQSIVKYLSKPSYGDVVAACSQALSVREGDFH